METHEREKQRAVKWLNSDVIFFFFQLTLSFLISTRQDENRHYVMRGEVNVGLPPGTDSSEDVKCQ